MRQRDVAAQLSAFKWKLRLAAVPELTRLVARGRVKQARFMWSALGLLVDGTRQFLVDARKRNVCETASNAAAQTIEGGIGRGNQELRPRQPARIGFVILYPVAVSAIVFADVVVVVAAFEPSLSRQQPRAAGRRRGRGTPRRLSGHGEFL